MQTHPPHGEPSGIEIGSDAVPGDALEWLQARLAPWALCQHLLGERTPSGAQRFAMDAQWVCQWAPQWDTTGLSARLGLNTQDSDEGLEAEILLSMLLGPVLFAYPSLPELAAAVRIRRHIVQAARRTALAFHTSKIERPTECWTYVRGRGFLVLPGVPLIHALRQATQPVAGGARFAFSCYRATEYVILLGLAQELERSNPALLAQLQHYWGVDTIASGQFHEVFLREYGSMERPLPMHYYVPGDRLWFRNPDEASADITGYEGSWVFYLGQGLFSNFWESERPFTLETKCVEIYHWRHGPYLDEAGEWQMDEARVAQYVAATMADPTQRQAVVQHMMRWREPRGVYEGGGCIDTTREYPRWVCPSTADLVLPVLG